MNIEKLLKKKGWTGAELGRLQLYNVFYAYGMVLQGSPDPKGVVSPAEFKKMLDTIREPEEVRAYNNYITLHEWLTRQINQAYSHQQQALLNFEKLEKFLIVAEATEKTYQYIEQLPFIVTPKQIEDRKQEVKAPYFTGNLELSVCNLIAWAVDWAITDYENNPRKKSLLKPLKKELEAQTLTAEHILSSYNEVWGNGYYTLPDGKSTSSMSYEDWLDTVEPIVKKLEEKHEDGELSTTDFVIEKSRVESGGSLAKDSLAPYGFVWHYDADPESLNKWAVLTEGDFIESYYQDLRADKPEYRAEQAKALEAFKEEYPEVFKAVMGYIERFFTGAGAVEDWTEPLYSWEDLYNKGFAGFDIADFEDPLRLWDGNYRATHNGIAVYQPTFLCNEDRTLDEKGHYKAPELTKDLEPLMLDALFTESEYYADTAEALDGARELLLDSYYFLMGYNKILDMIADYYEVEGLGVLHVSAHGIEQRVERFNFISKWLYRCIQDTVYEEEYLREKKLEVMEEYFKPIHLDAMELPEADIEAVRKAFKGFRAFKEDALNPITLLCIRHKEEGV